MTCVRGCPAYDRIAGACADDLTFHLFLRGRMHDDPRGQPRVRRGAEEAATRTRARTGVWGARSSARRRAGRGRRSRGAMRCVARQQGAGVALDLGEPVAHGRPADREQDRDHREDRQRVGVEPRCEQRPAARGRAARRRSGARYQSDVAPKDASQSRGERRSRSVGRYAGAAVPDRRRAGAPRRPRSREPEEPPGESRRPRARRAPSRPRAGTGSSASSVPRADRRRSERSTRLVTLRPTSSATSASSAKAATAVERRRAASVIGRYYSRTPAVSNSRPGRYPAAA